MSKIRLWGTAALASIAFTPAFAASASKRPNPLLARWPGPFGGVPPFDKIKVSDFKPALKVAMAENLGEIEAIAADPRKPDFDNTIAAFERAGRTFSRVTSIYGVYATTMDLPDFQAVESEMNPVLSAFGDRITQNERLFARIAAVYDAREKLDLTPEQKRLVWLDYTGFVRFGAKLSAALVDMKLHLAATPDKPSDPEAFERDTLADLGMPNEIVMRHRTAQFFHLFASDNYSAGYYSYLWSQTLADDAWEAFQEAGGAYDPAIGKRLRDDIFSVGNTLDPADAYRNFRGHDPGVAALMRARGFPEPASPALLTK